MLVKVCGITRPEDAAVAVGLGARALGFLFWPGSPRFIEPVRARAIARTLPPFVTPVGLFVNQPIDEVNRVAAEVGLGAVQLHGDESVEYAERVERPVVKALSIGGAVDMADVDRWPARVVLLLDAHDPERRGGTGRMVDWAQAAAVAARRRTLLAGGLRPDNVAEAIARVRPFGIDVSSGVEAAPGVKDHERLRALFEAVSRLRADHDAVAFTNDAPRS
jgi:phosphoribosylanthranilate isomerase